MRSEERIANQCCLVCNETYDQLYSLSDCKHKFCFECCSQYIQSRCSQFQPIKCMFEGCNMQLDKNTKVYKQLSPEIKQKIKKHERMVFLQKNSDFRSCGYTECDGLIKIKKTNKMKRSKKKGKVSGMNQQSKQQIAVLACNISPSHIHCFLCNKPQHQGDCKLDDEQQFYKLNFKRCPECSIWVQKVKGCQYIKCKCGISFCFTCGKQFSKDPCRKRQVWQQQQITRARLRQLKIRMPQTKVQYALFIPRIIFIYALAIVWTLIACLLPMGIIFCLGVPLLFLLCPLLLLFSINQINEENTICCTSQRFFWKVMLFLFYPFIGTLFASVLIIVVLFYPFLRKANHHGIYDPFDYAVSRAANIYLTGLEYIVQI